MNDHEAQRIAAAMHELRPDWPTSSLLTLIRKNLIDKPRRDVTVALAWVACESNSHTPARVLESGPWWKAVGIEGATTHRQPFDPRQTCNVCGKSEADCRRNPHGEHEFHSIEAARAERGRKHPDAWMDRHLPRKKPDDETEHVAAIRAELNDSPAEEESK